MTVPLFYARNPNQFLYVYALTAAYRAGFRVYDPDYGLSREPDIWEKIRRDPIVMHALELRTHMIAGREWMVEPATDRKIDKLAADVMKELLENVQNFSMARYNLAQAVGCARTYAYISGDRKPAKLGPQGFDGSGLLQNWWRPNRLKDIDRRRFYYEPIWYRTPTVRLQDARQQIGGEPAFRLQSKLWSIARGRWEDWHNADHFVKLIYQDYEGRLGYGRGLTEAIYHYYYIKTRVQEEGLQGLERWSQGMLVGKIQGLREGSVGKDNASVSAVWLDLLNRMRARHVAVCDKEEDITVVQPSGTGHQMVTEFLTYLDNAITRLILGAVLPSGGDTGSSGSFARAQVETNTMEALIQFDRQILDEALTRDLIGLVWKLNGPQLRNIGLAEAKMPRFRTAQEDRSDPVQNAQTATLLINAGIPLVKKEVYRKTGWSMPTPEDEVLTAPVGVGAGNGGASPTLPSLPTIKEV